MDAVFLGGVDVRVGVDRGARRVGRRAGALGDAAADQQRFCFAGTLGLAAHPGEYDPRFADGLAVHRQRDGHASQGEVAVATGELHPRLTGVRLQRRKVRLDEDLVGLEQGGQIADEEVLGGDRAPDAWPDDAECGVEAHGYGGELGRRIGVRQAAADGAARADRGVADVADRLDEQRLELGQTVATLDRYLAGHGPYGEPTLAWLDVRQLGDAIEIDQ